MILPRKSCITMIQGTNKKPIKSQQNTLKRILRHLLTPSIHYVRKKHCTPHKHKKYLPYITMVTFTIFVCNDCPQCVLLFMIYIMSSNVYFILPCDKQLNIFSFSAKMINYVLDQNCVTNNYLSSLIFREGGELPYQQFATKD